MKVAKFGGSSVSNAKQIKKVLDIVNGDPERKIIIVSAPGKGVIMIPKQLIYSFVYMKKYSMV